MNSILSNIDNDKLTSAVEKNKSYKYYDGGIFDKDANTLRFGYIQYRWDNEKKEYIKDNNITLFYDDNIISFLLDEIISLNRKNKIRNILNSEK